MTSTLLWTLIALQIAMGAFDTIYHHELTERLAWRPSQANELRLHAVRNVLYALIFLTLGLSEVHGAFAAALLAVLVVEVVITLMDFVEEDISRKLPASERINHTLLALNYGAILALAVPVLLAWAQRPTAVVGADHGLWSVLCVFSALAVAIFGVRDWFASARAARLALGPAGDLVAVLPQRKTVLVTGATGFIGRRLVEALSVSGHAVIVLARSPAKASALRPPYWLVTSLDDIPGDTRIDAIVNLAGEPIADRPWTARRRTRLLSSRVEMTQDVVRLIERLDARPSVLVSGSAIGWYGLNGDEQLTETSTGRACFSHALTAQWEAVAEQAKRYKVRVVCLRIGLVLGVEGGLLSKLLFPFEFGLGGPMGDGHQWMSWIARDDLVRLIAHAIATPALDGPLNATAPNPVRNRDFAQALGRALGRPAILPVPALPLRMALGDFANELLLGGQRVLPAKALVSGFVFRHGTIEQALGAIVGANTPTIVSPALVSVVHVPNTSN